MLVRYQLCDGDGERDLDSSCEATKNISADYSIDVLSHGTKNAANNS